MTAPEDSWDVLARIVANRALFDAASSGAENAGHALLRRQILAGARSAGEFRAIADAIGPAPIRHVFESLSAQEIKRILRRVEPSALALDPDLARRRLAALLAVDLPEQRPEPPAQVKAPRLTGHSALSARRTTRAPSS